MARKRAKKKTAKKGLAERDEPNRADTPPPGDPPQEEETEEEETEEAEPLTPEERIEELEEIALELRSRLAAERAARPAAHRRQVDSLKSDLAESRELEESLRGRLARSEDRVEEVRAALSGEVDRVDWAANGTTEEFAASLADEHGARAAKLLLAKARDYELRPRFLARGEAAAYPRDYAELRLLCRALKGGARIHQAVRLAIFLGLPMLERLVETGMELGDLREVVRQDEVRRLVEREAQARRRIEELRAKEAAARA